MSTSFHQVKEMPMKENDPHERDHDERDRHLLRRMTLSLSETDDRFTSLHLSTYVIGAEADDEHSGNDAYARKEKL